MLAYLLFLLMGLTLGLIGAGGSILTIPILIYVVKIPVVLSTTYSLFIVGISAAFGVVRHWRIIAYQQALLFALPSLSAVSLVRYFIVPHLKCDDLLIGLLLAVMLLAAYFMTRTKTLTTQVFQLSVASVLKTTFLGFSLGATMGLLGAGGGFLIVPTLVLVLGVPIKQAVTTSLFIITLNSGAGFLFDKSSLSLSDYQSLLFFIMWALIGMLLGLKFSTKISADYLKKAFAGLVVAVALAISIKQYS